MPPAPSLAGLAAAPPLAAGASLKRLPGPPEGEGRGGGGPLGGGGGGLGAAGACGVCAGVLLGVLVGVGAEAAVSRGVCVRGA